MESMTKALVLDEDLICLNVAAKLFKNFNFKGSICFPPQIKRIQIV